MGNVSGKTALRARIQAWSAPLTSAGCMTNVLLAYTDLGGALKFSARTMTCSVWQAMSPIAPVPKSHQPRQLNGW